MARITKKRLKEDKFVSITTKISIFLNEHWKEIVGAIAGIVVIVGAIVSYYGYNIWKNDNAVRILDEAMTLYREATIAMEKDGRMPSTTGKYEKARTKFQEVIQNGGRRSIISEALFYSAKCSYQAGRYSGAIADFENIVKKHSKSLIAISAQEGIGNCYEQIGDNESLKKAIQQYDELSKYPESYVTVRAIIDKGRCYEKLGEFDQALTAYKTIVDRFKVKVESAIQAKAKALVLKARDVISKYETVLGKDQSDAEFNAFLDKAKTYEQEKQEQWLEALRMYDKAIFSKNEYWHQQKALDESAKQTQEAEKALREYQDQSMEFIENVNAGRKYEEQGDFDNALKQYNRAMQFDFLPGMDMFEEAQLRINWINSVEKRLKDVEKV